MSFFLSLFISLYTNAVEPVNPLQHCDRFVQSNQKTFCENKMNKLKPDWYLANVCSRFFEDDDFYECIELTTVGHFDPIKITLCENEEKDGARMTCIKQNAQFGKTNDDYQNFTLQKELKTTSKESRKPAFKADR